MRLQAGYAIPLHDEIHMVSFVKGLLHKGYPYIMLGPFEIPLSTYELVPYPIALSTLLFASTILRLRLPAAIAWDHDHSPHLTSSAAKSSVSALASCCPPCIPSVHRLCCGEVYLGTRRQVQFFALLTSYLFYRAVQAEQVSAGYLYLAAIAFILTYLSWEGAGFFCFQHLLSACWW